jgi:hypothetical protein
MVVETLNAEPAEVAATWPRRQAQIHGEDSALFRIVRDIGEPWDASGPRETVAIYRGEPSTDDPLPAWPEPAEFAAGDGTAWTEVHAGADARPYGEVDGFMFMIEVHVEPDIRDAFDSWYTNRHVPDVHPAGLVGARRYTSTQTEARFLTTYEMKSPAVLSSPELAKVRGFDSFTDHVIGIDRLVLRPVELR